MELTVTLGPNSFGFNGGADDVPFAKAALADWFAAQDVTLPAQIAETAATLRRSADQVNSACDALDASAAQIGGMAPSG